MQVIRRIQMRNELIHLRNRLFPGADGSECLGHANG
jgi:hypothetical protein